MALEKNSTDLKNNPEKNQHHLKLNKSDLQDLISARRNYEPNEHRRILRNVIVLAISFVFLFTAYFSMASLQSSLNKKNGLGSYSLATVYLSLTISSLFVPSLAIHKFGCKWTLLLSMIGYITYIAAQFYPTFATLIPAGILLGMCACPLWAAQPMYLTKIGEEYAHLSGQTKEVVLQKLFGIFGLIYQTAHIWGNLIAATLLASDDKNYSIDLLNDNSNNTKFVGIVIKQCGADHCPHPTIIDNSAQKMEEEAPTDTSKLYLLSAIFLASSILAAMILIFFLDSLDRYGESIMQTNTEGVPSIFDRTMTTIKHWANPYQLLIIPMTTWVGIGQGFIGADFTAGYISCAWSVHQIGYIFICYGIITSLTSFIFGRITEYVGRPTTFILAHTVQLIAVIIMMEWKPDSNSPILFYLIAGLWASSDGIFSAQVNALNGVLFSNTLDAAFSNNRLWNSIGYLIAYINANKLCMAMKLFICLIAIGISTGGYLLIEFGLRHQLKKKASELFQNTKL